MSAATLAPSPAPIARRRVSSAPRRGLVRRAVTELRLKHGALRAPITMAALRAVCDREGINLDTREIAGRRLGAAVAFPLNTRDRSFADAVRMIWLDPEVSGALALYVLAHEIGHHMCHLTPAYLESFGTRTPRPFWMPRTREEQRELEEREAEANYFADLLVGPELAALARQQLEAFERAA